MASRSRVLRALVVAVVVTGALVAAGVALRSPDAPPAPRPPAAATGLSSIDTTTAVVRRGAWCDAVPSAAVREAVGETSPTPSSWSNGDPLGSGPDVAHEFGCTWTASTGTAASAWVFAPPVTVARGQELVASARAVRGCTPLAGAPAFGSPSIALSCTSNGATTVSYRGLFGDAWLVCQVARSGATDPAEVADHWCASVRQAAGATSGSS